MSNILTILSSLNSVEEVDRAVEILQTTLGFLRNLRSSLRNKPTDKAVLDLPPPTVSGPYKTPLADFNGHREKDNSNKDGATGEKRSKPDKRKEKSEETYAKMVRYIAHHGPTTITDLAVALDFSYQYLYDKIKHYRPEWFEVTGGRVYITNEARQHILQSESLQLEKVIEPLHSPSVP